MKKYVPYGLLTAAVTAGACGDSFTASQATATSTTGTATTTTTTTTTGTGGAGGAGSTTTGANQGGGGGAPCIDADGDGYTTCAGDCADEDYASHPGAPEICGDALDNDCDGDPDPQASCSGKGTWVSSSIGLDTNPGTQALPVKTINQGIQNSLGLAQKQPVYVASGHYAEKIVLEEGVSLLGGYHCGAANDCTWARDFADTAILAVDWIGTYSGPSITRATVVEGFRLQGKDGAPTGNMYPEGIALTVEQSAPSIIGNTINGATVSGCVGLCGSVAVAVGGLALDPAGALLADNIVNGGDSQNWSVGIAAGAGAKVEIVRNKVHGGPGDWSRGIALGGVGSVISVVGNEIDAGSCKMGTSFAIFVGDVEATVDKNRINLSPDANVYCNSGATWSGGIEAGPGIATITNNVVRGMASPFSAAVQLRDGEQPLGTVELNGNTLDGAGDVVSAAIVIGPLANGAAGYVGSIRNNILLGGAGTTARVGIFEESVPGETLHPVALENCAFFFSPMVNVALVPYRYWNGANVSVMTVPEVNASLQLNANANIEADPKLDATYHLTDPATNGCINVGTPAGAPVDDMDGDMRPMNGIIDIGADEAG